MTQYQVESLLLAIAFHTDCLALPLSDRDCIIAADARNVMHRAITANIDYLFDRSLIDSLQRDELTIALSDAYIYGGV